jgi:murein endopeptidase
VEERWAAETAAARAELDRVRATLASQASDHAAAARAWDEERTTLNATVRVHARTHTNTHRVFVLPAIRGPALRAMSSCRSPLRGAFSLSVSLSPFRC